MSSCPTVRIKSEVEGIEYFVINESDFDPEKHALFEAPKQEASQTADSDEPADAESASAEPTRRGRRAKQEASQTA